MRAFFIFVVLFLGCSSPDRPAGRINLDDQRPHWLRSDFPLRVWVDQDMSAERKLAVQDSINMWNTAVGSVVFTIEREIVLFSEESLNPPKGVIVASEGNLPNVQRVSAESLEGGSRLNTAFDGRINHAYVSIDYLVPDYDAYAVFAHEFGHSLGLSHDEDVRSIMYRSASGSWRQIQPDDIEFVQSQINGRSR